MKNFFYCDKTLDDLEKKWTLLEKNHVCSIVLDSLMNTKLIGPDDLICFLANDWAIGCSVIVTSIAKLVLLWPKTGQLGEKLKN